MKKKILLGLLIIALFTVTGCNNSNSNSSSESTTKTFKIKDVSIVFDEDSEFHNFKYKNMKGIEPDESKQAIYLEYKNNDIYDGRFTFRIGLLFTSETTLKEFLADNKYEDKTINGISWKKVKVDGTTDGKETSSVIYATEKDSTVYVVNGIVFKESNVDIDGLVSTFINDVTIK